MTRVGPPAHPAPRRYALPRGVRLGAVGVAIGALYDLAEHGFAGATSLAGHTPLGQHLAHLIVLIGMVIILAAIVLDGVRHNGRLRPEGSSPDAVR
jgi:hypothetical protein